MLASTGLMRDLELAAADLDPGAKRPAAEVLVEAVRLAEVAGDDVEVAVPVHVDEPMASVSRGSSVRGSISGAEKSSRSSIAELATSQEPADVAAVAEVAAAVVQVAPIELAEGTRDEVEVAVVVDVAERDVARERLVAADILARGRGGERRRRAVVAVEPVGPVR
jgi:hypothetical protein